MAHLPQPDEPVFLRFVSFTGASPAVTGRCELFGCCVACERTSRAQRAQVHNPRQWSALLATAMSSKWQVEYKAQRSVRSVARF